MIHIKEILIAFTKEEQEEFILFLSKKNKRKDVKNIELVKLLLSDHFSSKEIAEKLYGKQNKVALHALRKRLFTSLLDFTANLSIQQETSLDIQLIKYIISARSFLKKGQIKIAYQILEKTIGIAQENQLFTILNEVYHTKIEYAYKHSTTNIDKLIANFKENQQQLLLHDSLNIAYAKIRKSLQEYQHQQKNINIKKLIEDNLRKQKIDNLTVLSFKSLYQIIQITNISSVQKFNYWDIEEFVLETYQLIQNHTSKNKQLYYHIEILYIIANILFRNRKFKKSLEFLDVMLNCMKEDKQKYFKQYIYKHQLILALNLNFTNQQDKAITLLASVLNKKNIDIVAKLDIELSLIVFYFQNSSLHKAKKLFANFYHTDKWYIEKAGIVWIIKKNLIEILLLIDLGDIDLVDSRLRSFKKKYTKILANFDLQNVLAYLKLIEAFYKQPEIATSKEFYTKVNTSFNWIENKKEDIFMMSFYAWLKAKMTKKGVYEITLNLVNK